MFKVPVIVIGMVVGYVIGAILIAFDVAVLYEIFSGSSTGLQIVYYPAAGTILLIIGGGVCYGVYESGKSKKRGVLKDSTDYRSASNSIFYAPGPSELDLTVVVKDRGNLNHF